MMLLLKLLLIATLQSQAVKSYECADSERSASSDHRQRIQWDHVSWWSILRTMQLQYMPPLVYQLWFPGRVFSELQLGASQEIVP